MRKWLILTVILFAFGIFFLPAQESMVLEKSNLFVRDVILNRMGKEPYDLIFEGKYEDTNTMFDSFKKNPNLDRLDPNVYDIQRIQKLADSGILVLMIYQDKAPGKFGHIAFVGNSGLTLSTIPAIPGHEGKKGTSLPKDELVLVQGGYYAGTVSIRYVIDGWDNINTRKNLLENSVYFYCINKR